MTIYAFNLTCGGKVPFLFRFLPPKWKFRLLARYGAKYESVHDAQQTMKWIFARLIDNNYYMPDTVHLSLPFISTVLDDVWDNYDYVPIPESTMKRIRKLEDQYNETYALLEQKFFFSGRNPNNKPRLLRKLFSLVQKILLIYGEFVRKYQYKAIYKHYLENESRWNADIKFEDSKNDDFVFGDMTVCMYIDESEGQKLIDVRANDPYGTECNGTYYFDYFNSIRELVNKDMPPLGRVVFVRCKENI